MSPQGKSSVAQNAFKHGGHSRACDTLIHLLAVTRRVCRQLRDDRNKITPSNPQLSRGICPAIARRTLAR